ncbi:MAG: glycosyltransferase 87 family protein [Gaiellaceae bacterium]
MQGSSRRGIALKLGAVVIAAIVLPVGARALASQYHDDSLWANSLRSLAGLHAPFDFDIFLQAGEAVSRGDSPYVEPDVAIAEGRPAPYVYPPVLAFLVAPLTLLPDTVRGSSTPGILFTLVLIACTVGALWALDVRDWRCYPVALLYPVTLENLEYGAIGPALALLVALGWRYRDRAPRASAAIGAAVVLKVFLWPLIVWLAATRRWKAAAGAAATTFGLALVSWAAIGFRGLADYPSLLRRLSDVEAERSYSAFAILRTIDVPETAARVIVVALCVGLLALAWRAARAAESEPDERDRRALTLALAAGFVLTPILWLHYLVLLVVPIALARPRLSMLWLAPLTLTVFEALDWYRGWPRGDGTALVSVAAVVAIVFVGSLWSRPRVTRLAQWR